jgi:hypothetical protein
MPKERYGNGPGCDANVDAGRDYSDTGDRGAGSFAHGGHRGDVAVTQRQASNQREIDGVSKVWSSAQANTTVSMIHINQAEVDITGKVRYESHIVYEE